MSSERSTIRFEDLGEPVQKLLRHLKNDIEEDDLELLTFVSVKDMAKIYSDLSLYSNSEEEAASHAEEMWAELKGLLHERREQIKRRDEALQQRERALLEEEEKERQRQQQEDEEEKKEEEETPVVEEAAPAEEGTTDAAKDEADEAARREAAEKKEKKRLQREEKKRKKREARAREAEEERQQLLLEKELLEKQKREQRSKNQKKEWENYVLNHPLEFAERNQNIQQEKVAHLLNTPSVAVDPNAASEGNNAFLRRTYTPKCPNCFQKFPAPPPLWQCPYCYRREGKEIKVWQPDVDENYKSVCALCQCSVGRFTRHHCRSCGRLACGNCTNNRAVIQGMGYGGTVKVCDDCANMPGARVIRS
ncbi:FYVE zinc finger containing protein, putative [Angomonas deanei]|uniref:FYVE zinc finger containing protein, putative n=1 Tax=Angomonas deanei TaxID=59799 RepID=A0A7G2CCE1_9TRYP|nr:FYVE zinc finger containing protein, putative [Angomonas deanei]